MAWFRRKKSAKHTEPETSDSAGEQSAAAADAAQATDEVTSDAETRPERERVPVLGEHTADELGPFDSGAVSPPEGFLDFGSVWVPNVPGVSFMVEADQQTQSVTGLRVQIAASVLQLQVFAAPKSRNLWSDIREEIAAGLQQSGGGGEVRPGPYGDELFAAVPVRSPNGAVAQTMMRFLGVDGPRWFLRGVLSGPAATDEELARPFIDLLRVVVVHRGSEPMAPRELLPMHMPRDIENTPAPTSVEDGIADELKPFERGPEITEVR